MAVAAFRKYFIPVWRSAPLLRICLPLMFGIGLGNALLDTNIYWYYTLPASIACALIWSVALHKKPLLASIGLLLGTLAVGTLLVQLHAIWQQPAFAGHHYTAGQTVVATLAEPAVPKEKSVKANASIALLLPTGQLQQVKGEVLLYLAKDSNASLLKYGQQIIFNRPLQPIKNAGNPGGFNYQTYAARQGVFYQVFLKANQYKMLPGNKGNAFRKQLFAMRQWVLQSIVRYIPNPLENGVAQALLIGYRGDLDKTLVEQYANTGVVHIIAISGMHLGMIYTLLLFLLKPLGQTQRMRLLRLLLTLGSMWLFTLLTGAAPSITRAAVMFSMVAVGDFWQRGSNAINMLSAAAIALLLYDPFALWNVGFQLSFAAVLSIAIFYKPILAWFNPGNKILLHVWQMMAVTIAAQILTLPLGIYHFHQFPVYFLLANLVAVPLSGAVLYALLIMLALSWWPFMASLVGQLAGWGIAILNACIIWVSQLPFTTIQQVQISMPMAVLLCCIIAGIGTWWLLKSSKGLLAAAASLALYMLLLANQKWQTATQHQIIIYNIPQYSGIDIVQGTRSIFIGDTALTQPGFLQNFHLLPTRIRYQYQPYQYSLLDDSSNVSFVTNGLRISILRQQLNYKQSGMHETDLLIVSGNVPGNPAKILPHIRCKQIVLDGSNSAYRIARWKSAADSLHLRLHSVAVNGAFVVEQARL
ncbi:ComEC/Rec2 family competence protein [Phnomibacter sp. MR]|uniref:ComEC/Rec2 family competence protein n=1 Tax=Phnomibacter sp. MR TaxID=3042318 RepID=UPI003A7FA583